MELHGVLTIPVPLTFSLFFIWRESWLGKKKKKDVYVSCENLIIVIMLQYFDDHRGAQIPSIWSPRKLNFVMLVPNIFSITVAVFSPLAYKNVSSGFLGSLWNPGLTKFHYNKQAKKSLSLAIYLSSFMEFRLSVLHSQFHHLCYCALVTY